MLIKNFTPVTLKDNPDLMAQLDQLNREAWPEFMLHMDVKNWDSLFTTFSRFQLLLLDPAGQLMAFSHTVPLIWDGTRGDLPTNLSEIIDRGLEAHNNQRNINTLVAFAAVVGEEFQDQGLSTSLLQEVTELAATNYCSSVIVPVRPILKNRYPLTPMEHYVQWTDQDGAPFDPWIRVHWRLGAEIMKVAPATRTVTGTVPEWEAWTGMRYPESGEYIVPGALQPVTIDCERNVGYYEEPTVWVKHLV